MRGLGMTPILPAFAGHIPKGLIDKFKPKYTELVQTEPIHGRRFVSMFCY